MQLPKLDSDPAQTTAGAAAISTKRPAGKRWRVMVAAITAVMVLTAAGYLYFHRTPKLTGKDTIVLADFSNMTGDPVFDGTLRQDLAVQLEQSPFLSLISDGRIQQVLRLMGKTPDARLTPEIAREICERTASAAVLDSSIASLGSQYVLGLRAQDCRTGDVLAEEQAQAARKEDVLNVLSLIASKLRTRLGESITTVREHDTPLAEATTPSLEALKAYSAGWQVSFASGSAAAVPFFRRAVEIDPNFASAYVSLGRMYGDIGGAGNLYSAYVRGLAWLAAHKGDEAAGEFRKILDHRGIVLCDPIGALARLQLGRAYALSGDKSKARSAYDDFLALWKDADPDIPILKQARAEYAKLQ